jgi:hypothetical protein
MDKRYKLLLQALLAWDSIYAIYKCVYGIDERAIGVRSCLRQRIKILGLCRGSPILLSNGYRGPFPRGYIAAGA